MCLHMFLAVCSCSNYNVPIALYVYLKTMCSYMWMCVRACERACVYHYCVYVCVWLCSCVPMRVYVFACACVCVCLHVL